MFIKVYYNFLIKFSISLTISVTRAFSMKNMRILSEISTIDPSEIFLSLVQSSGKSYNRSVSVGVNSRLRSLKWIKNLQ